MWRVIKCQRNRLRHFFNLSGHFQRLLRTLEETGKIFFSVGRVNDEIKKPTSMVVQAITCRRWNTSEDNLEEVLPAKVEPNLRTENVQWSDWINGGWTIGRKLLERDHRLDEQILHILQTHHQIFKVFKRKSEKQVILKTHHKNIIGLTVTHNHSLNHSTSWVQSTIQALMNHLDISNMVYWSWWWWCSIIIAIFSLIIAPADLLWYTYH